MNMIKVIIVMMLGLMLQACVVMPEKVIEKHSETVIIWPELKADDVMDFVYVDKFCELPSLPALLNIEPVNPEKYKKRNDSKGYINALKKNNERIANLLPKIKAEYRTCQQSLSL